MRDKWIVFNKIVIYGCSLLFLLFLSINSFLYTSDGYEVNVSSPRRLAEDFLGCFIFFGFCWLFSCLAERLPKKVRFLGLVLAFLTAMLFSAWWIINSANLPQSDAKSIYDIAYRAKNHDLLPIAPTGSYMSLWPFQAGLVLFFEVIFRLIPVADEMTIQWLYMPFMALSLVSGYMIVRKKFSTLRTRIFWCLLMLFCFPYYLYINNMYGEIPSIALCLFTLWMLLEYSAKPSWMNLLFAGLGLATAIALRKNTLIFVIACFLVWGVRVQAPAALSWPPAGTDCRNGRRYHAATKIL